MKLLVWLWVAASLSACAGSEHGPRFATSQEFPELPRKPPSFAAELTPTPENGDAALGSMLAGGQGDPSSAVRVAFVPLDSEAARHVVGRFFTAVLMESTRELFPLLASRAIVISEGNRQPAQTAWRARFAQLDYSSLAGRLLAPPQTLRTYTYVSLEQAKRDGAPAPQTPDEVVVVAGLGPNGAGKARLFGERLAFRLRPRVGDAAYEITEILEDFRLP